MKVNIVFKTSFNHNFYLNKKDEFPDFKVLLFKLIEAVRLLYGIFED